MLPCSRAAKRRGFRAASWNAGCLQVWCLQRRHRYRNATLDKPQTASRSLSPNFVSCVASCVLQSKLRWHQFINTVDFVIRDTVHNASRPCLRIDVVEFSGLDQCVSNGRKLTAALRPHEEIVLSAQCNRAHCAFGCVVIQFDEAVIEVFTRYRFAQDNQNISIDPKMTDAAYGTNHGAVASPADLPCCRFYS